jgi:hypothetical protein
VSDYEREGDALVRNLPIAEKVRLSLRAGDIHRERTGVHARLEIAANGRVLAWGLINTDRDEDRVRLTNSAARLLNNGHGDIYTKEFLKKDVDDFCRKLWDAEVARFEPAYDAGLEPAPPDFILEPFILRGGGTICFAPPGRGKSWTTMLMAVSIDAGISNVWPVTQAKVLILNLERSRTQYMRRIGAINRALGLPQSRPIAVLHARGRSLRDVIESARRLELTKKNDIPWYKPRILALEFDAQLGFAGFREARRGEFPTIEAGGNQSALKRLMDWTLDQPNGLGDASSAARSTGLNRSTVVQLYGNDEHFVFVRKEGRSALYGVKGSA